MALEVERIPTLRDNYTYLAICGETRAAAVIDAPEAGPVISRVEALGVRVSLVLSTHHHPDHSQANPALAERYQVPVLGHASDSGRLPGFTRGLEEGDAVEIGALTARVIHIPAHTTGHVAYVFDDPPAVFCGDTLFAAGCGRLFEGSPADMHAAMARLAALPPETRVYCGHEYTEANLVFAAAAEPENEAVRTRLEEVRAIRAGRAADWHEATPGEMTIPSTITAELATNPFMRAGDPEELGRRRSWKDRF